MLVEQIPTRDSERPEQVTPSELRDQALFGALSEEALAYLARELRVVCPQAGDVLFREGEEARDMFVVLRGEMEILKTSRQGTEVRVAILGPGDWFGEMGLVDIQRRSATVRALAPGQLLRVSSQDLDALYRHDLKAYALIVLNIARELSRRLRVADGILADFTANLLDSYLSRREPKART
ncbi:MAG: cyclic nucleotide-binding domain-containing protein [Polyangiaceae bacterium]|nr:cyclic nucleotide-binding domain-containing protein [Polyangiaceae bacterium]